MRSHVLVRLFSAVVLVAAAAPAARAQAEGAAAPHAVAIPLPDLSTRLIAVYGEHPLADSALAVLARKGYRVADRNATTVQAAVRRHQKLEPAYYSVLIEVRPDSLVGGPILVASLLDVRTVQRLRMASSLLPTGRPWGEAVEHVLGQLLER